MNHTFVSLISNDLCIPRSWPRFTSSFWRCSLSMNRSSIDLIQPQRGFDPKPRVGPSADLPWVRKCDVVQPQRGCGPHDLHLPSDRRVATPSGLVDFLIRFPSVARAAPVLRSSGPPRVEADLEATAEGGQPWALGRNPFGIICVFRGARHSTPREPRPGRALRSNPKRAAGSNPLRPRWPRSAQSPRKEADIPHER